MHDRRKGLTARVIEQSEWHMKVITYTSLTCSYCRHLKEFLSGRGIPFEDHDVTRDALAAQEAARLTGQNGVPVTVIDGQVVVGFDQPKLEQLLAQGQTRKGPSFGAAIADSSKMAKQGSPVILGAFVGKTRPGSIAEKMGLAPGDVIIQLNMERVANTSDLERALSSINESSRFSLVFIRGNTVQTAEATL